MGNMGNIYFQCHSLPDLESKLAVRELKRKHPVDKYTKESDGIAFFIALLLYCFIALLLYCFIAARLKLPPDNHQAYWPGAQSAH